ncbi:hypothetical protein PMSD_08025 [Paenibacillus macquariensis subsp. defensor]|nr:hypothetical protein PMSD_08025 [Paenibacillus macquariensis subsp. defensor]
MNLFFKKLITVVMISIILLNVGCSMNRNEIAQQTSNNTATISSVEELAKDPEDVSADISVQDLVESLEISVPLAMDQHQIPGAAIAVIERGEVVWSKGFGFADVENKIKVDETSLFQVASNSKPVTAWGVLKLVEEGKLDLNAPVEQYLSRWQIPNSPLSKEKVTIERLLSHTSGLSLSGYKGYPSGSTFPTLEQSLNGENSESTKVALIHEPGSKFQYSGGGYTVLQLLIEEVSQQSFSDFMKEEILIPLGMNDSLFTYEEKEVHKLSVGYKTNGDPYPVTLYTELAAAGLLTTISDYAKFVAASVDDKRQGKPVGRNVLTADSLKMMFNPRLNSYGLGYATMKIETVPILTHGGNNVGYISNFYINLSNGNGIVLLTNSDNGGKFIDKIAAEAKGWVLSGEK